MRKALLATLLIGLVPMAAGCASAQAKGNDAPGLAVPPPPPHVVQIAPEPIVEPVPEMPAPAGSTSRPPARPTPPRSSGTENRPEPKAGETKPAEQPATPDTPPPAPALPAGPAPQLRPAENTGGEPAVRATIDRTRNLLNTVDYRRLTSNRRKAYDDAKAFTQQAEDALKVGNVVFAQGVATKAETLAKELAGK